MTTPEGTPRTDAVSDGCSDYTNDFNRMYIHACSLELETLRLSGRVQELERALTITVEALKAAECLPELNMANFSHLDVEELNDKVSVFVLATRIALRDAALAGGDKG